MVKEIFTIGHSNHTFLAFLALIQAHQIRHIADIRSIPYSRHASWSNKSRLSELLKPYAIRYSYLGHQLGGKQSDPGESGSDTKEVAAYQQAIDHLIARSGVMKTTLLCAEADPARCHRQHLIAQSLLRSGCHVWHILKDGTLQEAWLEDPKTDQPALF